MVKSKFIHHLSCFFVLTILLIPINSYSKATDDNAKLKAEFIIDIANKITPNKEISSIKYKIGVVGKGSAHKLLISELNRRLLNVEIQNKPVEIISYRRVKNVKPVDLLVISGELKIKPKELKEKFGDINYILLTEDYPFGTSPVNFSIGENQKLIYEIQEHALKNRGFSIKKDLLKRRNRAHNISEWQNQLNEAQKMIDIQTKAITINRSTIKKNKKIIGEHRQTINTKNEQITVKNQTINYQRNQLIIAIISLLIIGGLSLLLLKTNKHRNIALNEVKEKNQNILDSLEYALNIQKAILPKNERIQALGISNYFIIYEPKDVVSGDFYWAEELNGKTYIIVADCTGHGVPGAMLSVICSNALTKAVRELKIAEPNMILDKSVEILKDYFSESGIKLNDGMDLALVCIDKKNNKIIYSGAHNPLFYFKMGKLYNISADKQPIGSYDYRKPYTQHELKLDGIETIYLFSDGYVDQFGGPRSKKYSKKRFKETLISTQNLSMEDQKKELKKNLKEWQGNEEQLDDICVWGVKLID